jgi:hydrogenase 3 maturation protease
LPLIWERILKGQLARRRSETGRVPRIAVLGVGNPMRSDDAAGVLLARALSERDCARNIDRTLILEAGQAPENRTGELRRFGPDVVIIIDAADMKEAPGTIRWIPEDSIDGMSASTHSLPLSLLARYLKLELNCVITILGIQLISNELGERVSPEILQAVEEVVAVLDELIRRLD